MDKIEHGADIIDEFMKNQKKGVTIREIINMLINEHGFSQYEAEEAFRANARRYPQPEFDCHPPIDMIDTSFFK